MSVSYEGIKALTFDVFGTVVDWRSSIIEEGHKLSKTKGIEVAWSDFADQWRGGYGPSMDSVRRGERLWTKLDLLHRILLDQLLVKFNIDCLSENEKKHLNTAWHRLKPWPDSVSGLSRLRERFIIATLSNGNVALLTNMAKYARLPWDCILSAELVKHYKPDPEAYLGSADLLGLSPEEVMMVAAHKGDLRAAQKVGFRSAFVARPKEFGPDGIVDTTPEAEFDFNATDFEDLATKLGL